jgi:hypothetical protein
LRVCSEAPAAIKRTKVDRRESSDESRSAMISSPDTKKGRSPFLPADE